MRLIKYEMKKALSLPVLWVFFGLCLALNILFIAENGYGRDYFNDTSGDAALLGQRIDEAFIEGLSELPYTENRDILLGSAASLTDVFADYDAAGLGAYYEAQFDKSPLAASWMRAKYERVSERVEALAAFGAGMELYAADMTYPSHRFLFGTLLRALTAEASIVGALAALYLSGCERMTRTVPLLCSARAGKRLWLRKAAAGTSCALLLWSLLAAASLGAYLMRWDYRGVWASSVSSGFNYVIDLLIVKPFITWGDFSVGGYLAASLGMSAAVTAVCSVLASLAGILIRHTYTAALALVLSGAGGLSITVWLENRMIGPAYIVSCFQPVILWMDEGVWFTDGGMNTVLPWQEPIAAAIWLALGIFGMLTAYRHRAGKDVL